MNYYAAHPYFVLCWSLMIVGEWYIASLALRVCRKQYPWFTTLVAVMALKSLILFYMCLELRPGADFYFYCRSDFLVSILQIGSAVEVFGTLFRPFWTVPRNSLVTLGLSTITSLAVIVKTMAVFHAHNSHGELAFYHSIDRIVSCTTGLVLAFILLFARYFEMPYRSRLKGIASGLLLMSVSSIAMAFLLSYLSRSAIIHLSFFPLVIHYATLATWIVSIERRESLVLIVERADVASLRFMLDRFKLAISNTPTSCGLTVRTGMGKALVGEENAKMVNHGE